MNIVLLISGGFLVLIGALCGSLLTKKGIELGNRLSVSSEDGIPINEEIIPTEQEITE